MVRSLLLLLVLLFSFISSPKLYAKDCFSVHDQTSQIAAGISAERQAEIEAVSKVNRVELAELKAIFAGQSREGILPETMLSYILAAEKQQKERGIVLSDYTTPERHEAAAKTWVSKPAPRMFRELLPDGVEFIDHSLHDAMARAVVKTNPWKDFVSLRVRIPVTLTSGEVVSVSMNVGVHAQALLENAGKPPQERYLIPQSAADFMISDHGGGTKGTGHHVDQVRAMYFAKYGSYMISVDGAFHAAAGTKIVKPADQENVKAELLERFVPPAVLARKGIGIGHSKGGMEQLMTMFRSDDPGHRLSKHLRLLISLSPPVDPLPEGTPREKERAFWQLSEKASAEHERAMRERYPDFKPGQSVDRKMIDAWGKDEAIIARPDGELRNSLTEGHKISSLGMFGYLLWLAGYKFVVPEHQGEKYLPTVVVSGANDFVGVGFQEILRKYLYSLKNVRHIHFGPRANNKGVYGEIGHLTMDHPRPDQMPPEYVTSGFDKYWPKMKAKHSELYELVRVITEESAGREFTLVKDADANSGALRSMIAEYGNNLAFRQFADSYIHFREAATPSGDALHQLNELLREKVGAKIKKINLKDPAARTEAVKAILDANRAEWESLFARMDLAKDEKLEIRSEEEFLREFARINAMVTKNYVPEGPQGAVAKKIFEERTQVEELMKTARSQMDVANLTLTGMKRTQVETKPEVMALLLRLSARENFEGLENVPGLNDIYGSITKEIAAQSKAWQKGLDTPDVLRSAVERMDLAKEQAKSANSARDVALAEHIFNLVEANNLSHETLINYPPATRKAIEDYQQRENELKKTQADYARLVEQEGLAGRLNPRMKELFERQAVVSEQIEATQKRASDLQYVVYKSGQLRQLLNRDYLNRVIPGYFRMVETSLSEILELPFEQAVEHKTLIRDARQRWDTLSKQGQESDRTELY